MPKSHGLSLNLTTKFLALHAMVFLVFGLIAISVFYSYRNIDRLISESVIKEIHQNIEDSGLLRELSRVFADTNLLVNTFVRREEVLQARGQELEITTKNLLTKTTNEQLQKALSEFAENQTTLFQQCAEVNRVIRATDAKGKEFENQLNTLEQELHERKVHIVFHGGNPAQIEELITVVSGYRETFLEMKIHYSSMVIEAMGEWGGVERKRSQPIFPLIADLDLRLGILTVADSEVKSYTPRMRGTLQAYARFIGDLITAMDGLAIHIRQIKGHQVRVIQVMAAIDDQIRNSTLDTRRKITSLIDASSRFILYFSFGVITLLAILTMVFILRNIRRPMESLRQGIESIRQGKLDTSIDLRRTDEWALIEEALNTMAEQLTASYAAMTLKNDDLEKIRAELQIKVVELVREIETRKNMEMERLRLEEQLRQAQKMEAVGTLAGGIAHDFNNLLQGMSGYVQLLLKKTDTLSEDRRYIEEMDRITLRATELVQRLLTFSRRIEVKPRAVNLNQVVESSLHILTRTIPKMITLKSQLAKDLKLIQADPTQMEQILLNLMTNSRDAMPEGGTVTIETSNVSVGEDQPAKEGEVPPGEYVRLRVSDSGTGMDRETLEHIFEPFFTTKGVGQGTGLGLSSVYGIVKSHGGHIFCASKPGNGTTFEVFLPVDAGSTEVEPGTAVVPNLRGGNETILLVDDETMILEVAEEALISQGYIVIKAQSGEECLEILGRGDVAVDLVVMDLGMPGMGGEKCLEEMKRIRPAIPVIVASGYSAHRLAKEPERFGAAAFVAKPYRLNGLQQIVRWILDQGQKHDRQDQAGISATVQH